MKYSITEIIDEAFEGDVLDEILSPDIEAILADFVNLSTDYSCQGCAF